MAFRPPDGPDTHDGFRPSSFDDSARDTGTSDRSAEDDAGRDGAGPFDALSSLRPFSIVVLPDTQFYSRHYPQVFETQTKWIIDNKDRFNVAFVLHLGDIVDLDLPGEWTSASKAMGFLDGKVPYVLAVGNHDLFPRTRFGMINAFFPVSRFAGQSWFRGTYEPNDMHNSYALFNVGGQEYLVIALEFGPRDGALAWADGLLKQHPKTPAILVTHAYLYKDGTRYNHKRTTPPQYHGPHEPDYGLDRLPGGVNDGEEMWDKLVSKNPNVLFVLSGHDVFDAHARLTSTRADGSYVHQILSNYQFWYTCPPGGCPIPGTEKMPTPPQYMGGNGWLRVMEFAPAAKKVRVRTYSPLLGASMDDGRNQFELDLP